MTRFDPYQNFKFRVKWEGRPVAGVNHISALKRTSEVVKDRPARRRSAYEAITLERGITHDPEVRGLGQPHSQRATRPGCAAGRPARPADRGLQRGRAA